MQFNSVKVYDGFSCCFRQWRAEGTHCKFLHGYGVSFEVTFEGSLDERNWVFDFGGMKRAENTIEGKSPNDWFKHMFDHTVLVSYDDPELELFKEMDKRGIIQLRIVMFTGAERFAQYLFDVIDKFVGKETHGRVRVKQIKFMEHNKNSATVCR